MIAILSKGLNRGPNQISEPGRAGSGDIKHMESTADPMDSIRAGAGWWAGVRDRDYHGGHERDRQKVTVPATTSSTKVPNYIAIREDSCLS
jgi:hypothetical protein